jgi:molybdopterin synthase sulfur carrier subunit
VDVLLFGIIAEKAGTARIGVEAGSVAALRSSLHARIPALDGLSYAIAVDRRIVHEDRVLTGHEEIAVLPPFAGG